MEGLNKQESTSFVSIHPYFTLTDKEKARPILVEFVEKTKNESKCLYYGWTFNENKMHCREAYENAQGVLEHLGNVGPLIEKLLSSGYASLDKIELHGPEAELAQLEQPLAHLNPLFFKKEYGFKNFFKTNGEESKSFISIHPYFTLNDKAKAQPTLVEFVEKTKKESKCVYYGWTINENKMLCREAYENAQGVLEHLGNIGPVLEKLLASGHATLEKIEVHGPAEELAQLEQPLANFNPAFFKTEYGFVNFKTSRVGASQM